MSKKFTVALCILFIFSAVRVYSQTFDGNWKCDYVTNDDHLNGTGYNTPAVGVINENAFVALVSNPARGFCYLVGYSNADSVNGRLGTYAYSTAYITQWLSGFDAVDMNNAFSIAATSDSLVYVPNNDVSHNILVFKLGADSVYSTDYRMQTGADSLYAIAVDGNGMVYVSSISTDPNQPSKVLVFKGIKDDSRWNDPTSLSNHASSPVATITLPDTGQIRGIGVNPEGTAVYISNFNTKKVYCYTGSPTGGYSLYNGFSWQLNDNFVGQVDSFQYNPGPYGVTFMKDKNLLFVANCIDNAIPPGEYEYGRIYILNPNTGEALDTIDAAAWNAKIENGTYNNHNTGIASGYTSPYSVAYDQNFNVYDQSFWSWTVDKWTYTGTLPTIPLSITGIKRESGPLPTDFTLNQNYPNPFNPSTNIEFSVNKESHINLSIYDITGKLVTKIIDNAEFAAGSYKVSFDASKLASGNYIYVLDNGTRQISKKMTLLK